LSNKPTLFMKIFRYSIIIIALILIVFNATKIDFEHPFKGNSNIAIIGILAAACAILLICILQISLQIKKKHKG